MQEVKIFPCDTCIQHIVCIYTMSGQDIFEETIEQCIAEGSY